MAMAVPGSQRADQVIEMRFGEFYIKPQRGTDVRTTARDLFRWWLQGSRWLDGIYQRGRRGAQIVPIRGLIQYQCCSLGSARRPCNSVLQHTEYRLVVARCHSG